MLTLPPEVCAGGTAATVERLKQPAVRAGLEEAFANPRFPIETIRLASVPSDDFRHYEGKGLVAAAAAAGESLVDFVCDLLIATNCAAGCVIRHFAARQDADIPALMRHPLMMAGSDGIYVGGRPHPRGTGCFGRYLGHHVRAGDWSLEEAVMKCSHHAARRFGLADRGLLRAGFAADVVVFDPAAIADRSTYDDGKALATGVTDVVVNGEFVLRDGGRTRALPGRGLKRK
jgi:N-acyl-D-amino-acid deacylase